MRTFAAGVSRPGASHEACLGQVVRGQWRNYRYVATEILLDPQRAVTNVCGVSSWNGSRVSLPTHEFAHPIERRSGLERRQTQPVELVNVFRPDDRRLGLGRRWDDWRHPPAQPAGSEAEVDDLP